MLLSAGNEQMSEVGALSIGAGCELGSCVNGLEVVGFRYAGQAHEKGYLRRLEEEARQSLERVGEASGC